jgi:hypothetical protein
MKKALKGRVLTQEVLSQLRLPLADLMRATLYTVITGWIDRNDPPPG